MSRIFLKGERDPLTVDYERGLKLKKFFEDTSIPNYQPITIDDWSGTKGDLKSIWLDTPTKEKFHMETFTNENGERVARKVYETN